jgi:hypothetical protein
MQHFRKAFGTSWMALRQLLLRFWVTDHGDCHFREESLVKVTVSLPRGAKTAVNPVNLEISRFTEFTQ